MATPTTDSLLLNMLGVRMQPVMNRGWQLNTGGDQGGEEDVRMQPVMNRGWQLKENPELVFQCRVRMQPVMNRGWQRVVETYRGGWFASECNP